jgi:hypothetical protein
VLQESEASRLDETATMFPLIREGLCKLVRASAQNNLWLGQGANDPAGHRLAPPPLPRKCLFIRHDIPH